jgi:uncharacterized protein YqfA (UPF0365 family)
MAIIFGLAVFAVIVAVGWRSVQNRRILRVQGANGEETIVVAREGDDISSVVTTTEHVQEAAPSLDVQPVAMNPDELSTESVFGRSAEKSQVATEAEADAAGRDRLSRVITSNR